MISSVWCAETRCETAPKINGLGLKNFVVIDKLSNVLHYEEDIFGIKQYVTLVKKQLHSEI